MEATEQKQETKEFDVLESISDEHHKDIFKKFKEIILCTNLKKAGALSETEKTWIDDQCLLRYLRARDFEIEKSMKMIEESIVWRRENKPHEITYEEVKGPLELGGMFIRGFDKKKRPIIYVRPGAYNPYGAETRVRFLIYTLERAINSMDKSLGVEKMCWILDFSDYGKRAKSPEGRQVAQNSLHALQNHYPERLGECFIINAPWFFSVLYTILSPFMHGNTKKKIHWVSGNKEAIYTQLSEHIEDSQLLEDYGGSDKYVFNAIDMGKTM